MAFTATAAVLVHALVSLDASFGLRDAEVGQLIQSASHKPERNVIEHTDHLNRQAVRIENGPKMTIDVTAKVTLIGSGMNNAHPGQAFALSAFANWYSDLTHGFPVDEGYFIIVAPSTDSPKGDLYETKYSLLLFWQAEDTIHAVAAP